MNRNDKQDALAELILSLLGGTFTKKSSVAPPETTKKKTNTSRSSEKKIHSASRTISMEGEGVVASVRSMEGEDAVPPVISMEGPPEEDVEVGVLDAQQKEAQRTEIEALSSSSPSSLVRALAATDREVQREHLRQAVVLREVMSTPFDRRRERYERMRRRVRRKRGE